MPRVRLLSRSFHIFLEPRSLARVHLTLHAYKCSAGSNCIWAFGHTLLIFLLSSVHSTISVLHEPAVYSIGLWYLLEAGCLNLRVKRIIQMFHFGLVVLSVLVYRHWLLPVVRYWLLPVNSPTAGHIWKHVFPKGSNDRYTVGEFFQYRFLPILFKTRCASKKNTHSKRKLQILNADFSPQF